MVAAGGALGERHPAELGRPDDERIFEKSAPPEVAEHWRFGMGQGLVGTAAQTGRVVRVGPGYLMPNPEYSEGEPWTQPRAAVRYLPVQAQPGDFAFFLRKEAVEISYQDKAFLIIHHAAILALVRPDSVDILKEIEGLLDEE